MIPKGRRRMVSFLLCIFTAVVPDVMAGSAMTQPTSMVISTAIVAYFGAVGLDKVARAKYGRGEEEGG